MLDAMLRDAVQAVAETSMSRRDARAQADGARDAKAQADKEGQPRSRKRRLAWAPRFED